MTDNIKHNNMSLFNLIITGSCTHFVSICILYTFVLGSEEFSWLYEITKRDGSKIEPKSLPLTSIYHGLWNDKINQVAQTLTFDVYLYIIERLWGNETRSSNGQKELLSPGGPAATPRSSGTGKEAIGLFFSGFSIDAWVIVVKLVAKED